MDEKFQSSFKIIKIRGTNMDKIIDCQTWVEGVQPVAGHVHVDEGGALDALLVQWLRQDQVLGPMLKNLLQVANSCKKT
jgi:hypothetical protein